MGERPAGTPPLTAGRTNATRTLMLWCPDWPITAAIREHLLAPDVALALVARGEVFACSPAARQDGVRRGLRIREAQALCPDLVALPYDPALDQRCFEPVLAAVETIVPGVQVIRPGLCALRVQGPSRYYGGEEETASVVFATLAAIGLTDVRIGIADAPFAAEQAAKTAEAPDGSGEPLCIIPPGSSPWFLSTFPLDVLEQPKLAVLLRRLGIRSLGEFAALNPADVRNRFGEEGRRAHRQASGLDHFTVVPRKAQAQLDVTVDFEPPLARIDQLAFAFRAPAERFVGGLRGAGLVSTAVRVVLHSESGEVSEHIWRHPRWFDADDIVDRVRWQLQGGETAGPGLSSGITRVSVAPDVVESLSDHADGLWGTGPDESINNGLARVQGMLGHGAVLTAIIAGGRLLADRRVYIPWGDAPPGSAPEEDQPWPGRLPGPMPATVFAEPVSAGVLDARGNGIDVNGRGLLNAEPAFFYTGTDTGKRRPVQAWAGPWPISERWWDPQGRILNRFQLVDSSGSAWLLLLENHKWWAEAMYD